MAPSISLSPAQRYYYDVNGYVLLKGIFTPAECANFARHCGYSIATGK